MGRSTPRGKTLSPAAAPDSPGPPSGSPVLIGEWAGPGLKEAGGMSRKGTVGGKLGYQGGNWGARGRGKGEGERDIAAGLPG